MSRNSDHHRNSTASAERRRHQRITLARSVQAQLGSEDVTILNVSEGGVMAQSASPLVVGSIHRLTADAGDDTFELWVRVVHAVRVTGSGQTGYVLNVAFVSALDQRQFEAVRRWAGKDFT